MAPDEALPDPASRAILDELKDMRVEMRADRLRSDERFEQVMREFREDSARREAATQKAFTDAFRDVRAVGLTIGKTLNRHTRILEHVSQTLDSHGRILERIDRKLGARDNGRPGQDNGR